MFKKKNQEARPKNMLFEEENQFCCLRPGMLK